MKPTRIEVSDYFFDLGVRDSGVHKHFYNVRNFLGWPKDWKPFGYEFYYKRK